MTLAVWIAQDSHRNGDGYALLLVASWTCFLLNSAFPGYPWPWQGAAGWFTSGLIYFVTVFI